MNKKLKRRLLILVAVLVVTGTIAINVIAYREAYAMIHFTAGNPRTQRPEKLTFSQKINLLFNGVNIPRPKARRPITDLDPAAKSLRIDSADGIKLGAWYCPGKNPDQLVILFHGYAAEKSATIPEAKAFLEMGFSVLLVDFQGSGESSEWYTTVGYLEADDVAAAVSYAKKHLPHRKIILYGQSMGAGAILRAVHSCDVHPDAIIVEAVFDNMLTTVCHRFEAMRLPSFPCAELLVFWGGWQAGFNGFKHNPVDYAASVDCPILFMHGADDPRAHLEEARRVFDAVHAPKHFKEFSGLRHEPPVIRFSREWKEAVSEFLKAGKDMAFRSAKPKNKNGALESADGCVLKV